MADSSHAPYTSFREDPRWQAARADYLDGEGDRDAVLERRLAAIYQMGDIEREYDESARAG